MNSSERKQKRSRRARRRQQRGMPINVAASVATILSLSCGIGSIFAAIRGDYTQAAYFIVAAMVFDMLDGTIARMTNSVSDFGKELDSLSDIVSFGVAPAILMYTRYHIGAGESGSPIAPIAIVFYICAAALRLARYNVYQSDRRDVFIGLPSPAAAGTIAAFALFCNNWDLTVPYWIHAPFTVAMAFLMVSNVHYPKKTMRAFELSPRRAFQFLVLCIAAVAVVNYAIQYSPHIVWFPLAMAYVLFGLVNEVIARVTHQKPVASSEDEIPEEEPTPSGK